MIPTTTFSPTTNLLLVKKDQILLIQRSELLAEFPGWYMLPGGKQEAQETVLEAAIRETYEETGLRAHSADLKIIATNNHDYKSKVYLVYIFVCKDFSGELKPSREGQPVWIAASEALGHPKLYPDLKHHIKIALDSPAGQVIFTYQRFDKNLSIIESR